MKRTAFILMALCLGAISYAKETKISQSQAILVELRDPAGEQEERLIRVKEVESNKVTQLTLQKEASSPQVWNGSFIIQFFVGDNSAKTLDFYDPTNSPYYAYISDGGGKSVQKIILFKTPEELSLFEVTMAEEKQKAAEKQEKQIAKQIQVVAPKGAKAPISAEKLNQLVRQQGRLQETTQMNIEEAQAKKRMALLEQQQKMSEEAKQKKKKEAAESAKKADAFYASQKYSQAEKLYATASELDPEAEAYFYRYGVSLYKVGNYNKSLAVLSMADVSGDNSVEKDYYVALNHMKLKDYDKARKEFVEIREENSPELSPMASFYAGNIEYQQQKFPEARKSMEYVIDNSKEPSLDKSAEDMLEQIDRMESFYESKKEKYRFKIYSGLIYDTNILNVAENNVSTDVKAWRLSYGASVLGMIHRTMTSDFGAELAVADYYSMNSTLNNDGTVQAADALEMDLNLPYHQEIKLNKNQMSLEVIPSYKNIYMATAGGSRALAIKTTALSTTLSAPIKSDLFLATKLDLSSDQSLVATSVGDDDLSGPKYGLTFTPSKLLDLKGEKILSGELSYLKTQSNGINNRSAKTGLAISYGFPGVSKGTSSLRLDYTSQAYAEATTPRTDTNMILTGSYTKDFNKRWNMLLSLQYTSALSGVESYNYNKFLVTSLFTYTTSILQK
ncbi:MAG TPA: tetratricopeptide repeat protein [Pseudobdellovibrionaceae bacterium]|jgi:TolA-binding protein